MSFLAKLRSTLREHELVNRGDTLVVGVSGGPDSLSLLHALRTLAPELELKLVVAHLNHQLRGAASDEDEAFVAALAAAWGLPFANGRWDVRGYAVENGLSIEDAARTLRYQFLVGVSNQAQAKAIAVAHNADDQVETILLHFLRGAGLAGLRGMSYSSTIATDEEGPLDELGAGSTNDERRTTNLIRPLLDVTRKEVEAYCAENDLQPRLDESNLDTTILRNRLRHEVIPYLETINPNFREVLRHSALSVSDDFDYIHQNVLGIFDRMTRVSGDAFVFDRKWFRALPINLQRGVLREAISRLRRLKNVGYQHIENARRIAAEKDAGAEATLPQGLVLVVGYDDFTIGTHLPHPDVPLIYDGGFPLNPGDEILLPETDWAVRVMHPAALEPADAASLAPANPSPPAPLPPSTAFEIQTLLRIGEGGRAAAELSLVRGEGVWSATFDPAKIRGQLVLRTRRPGERFAPRGMGGKHKSLHEFMIDEKIPRHIRDYVPILADEEKILWVVGYRQDERAQVTADSSTLLRVEFLKQK